MQQSFENQQPHKPEKIRVSTEVWELGRKRVDIIDMGVGALVNQPVVYGAHLQAERANAANAAGQVAFGEQNPTVVVSANPEQTAPSTPEYTQHVAPAAEQYAPVYEMDAYRAQQEAAAAPQRSQNEQIAPVTDPYVSQLEELGRGAYEKLNEIYAQDPNAGDIAA